MNKKEKWIFLRGLTRGTIHWGRFIEIFKTTYPEVEMEFLDIPGNGDSFLEETPVNPRVVITYLSSKSRFVKEGSQFHLCGISLGGMVALKWAELYPLQIQSVTVINCSLAQSSDFFERLNPKNYFKIIETILSKNKFIQEQLILSITSNEQIQNESYLKSFATYSMSHPISKKNFIRQLILAKNIRINSIKVPLKVICSINDRLVSHKCSEAIAKEFNGYLIVHQTAGHDLPLDEPEWLVKNLN